MPYKRPDLKNQDKEHLLQTEFGHWGINANNDEGWISTHLQELMDDGRFALHQFSGAVDAVKKMDLRDFKEEVAKARKSELVLKGKRALLSFLKKHVDKYKSESNAVSNEILRVTAPDRPTDPTKALLQELRFKEIRDNLRNITPKNRRASIAGSLERIQAILGNPDPNDIIINEDSLTELRREYAFKQDSSLRTKEEDQQIIYKSVRRRAGEINAAASKMLIYQKIDDPTPPAEHFAVFEPETEHEAVYAQNRIQSWEKKQSEIERKKELAENNKGVNLEIPKRIERVRRRDTM